MSKLLITGCGRSGTRYATKALALVGLELGHEKEGRDGQINWRAVGWSPERLAGYVVLHQVRHPLGVIASCHTIMQRSWDYACDVEPRIKKDADLLDRCMQYWVWWNKRAASVSRWTYRVENLRRIVPSILSVTGNPPAIGFDVAVGDVSNRDHSRAKSKSYPSVSYEDLVSADEKLASAIKEMAVNYGYDDENLIIL